MSLDGRIEESFARQLEALPAQTRRLMQLAAADPSGDPVLVWRAAGRLAIGAGTAGPAVEAGLAEFGGRVRFRHPLVRSAAYRSASVATRQELHGALAEATDPAVDPDRRAWHRAQAAPGPDEAVAAELELCAGRARRRGGLAAAAAFLERSAGLTLEPAHRAQRALAAAQAKLQAGASDAALFLLAMAQAGPLDELTSARVDLLRGQIAFASGLSSDAPSLLLKAAKRLESLDLDLARETYLSAWMAALFAGRFAGAGDLMEVSRAARGVCAVPSPQPAALVLNALTMLVTDGPAAAAPALRQVARVFASDSISTEEELRWGWLAQAAASALWDDVPWRAMLLRQVQLARDVGALDQLPIDLASLGTATAWTGDLTVVSALIAEADAVRAATGSRTAPFAAMLLASLRGDEAEAAPLIEATIADATARGQGIAVTYAHWAAAILANGLGRHADALAAAQEASQDSPALFVAMWALPELIEAAARTGNTSIAHDAIARMTESTQAGGTDVGLGLEARSRALVSDGEMAESRYREAIDRLGRTQLRPELARAHLLYGEWLRAENRRRDARAELRTAYDQFAAMGIEAFAERARRELLATGDTVRKRTVQTASELTDQEAHIAGLAVDGRTNVEIGTQLFLSTRTVEWHLAKVYSKLGVGSRRELRPALAQLERADPTASAAGAPFPRACSSSRRELMSSLANTLLRCHSTVRRPMNSWAPISWLVRPSWASRAISSSCGVRSARVSSSRLRTFSPVAWSSRRERQFFVVFRTAYANRGRPALTTRRRRLYATLAFARG